MGNVFSLIFQVHQTVKISQIYLLMKRLLGSNLSQTFSKTKVEDDWLQLFFPTIMNWFFVFNQC